MPIGGRVRACRLSCLVVDRKGNASAETGRCGAGSVSAISEREGDAAASALVPLRAVCRARDDVLVGGLADNHFAAQLDKIVRDPAHYPVYGDR